MSHWTEADVARVTGERAGKLVEKPQVHRPRTMNKWESAYAADVLEPMRLAGLIRWWGYEAMTLRLAIKTFYTPDFAVLDSHGALSFVEVKGYWRDDARAKLKVAASLVPMVFVAVTKQDGRWVEERWEP